MIPLEYPMYSEFTSSSRSSCLYSEFDFRGLCMVMDLQFWSFVSSVFAALLLSVWYFCYFGTFISRQE